MVEGDDTAGLRNSRSQGMFVPVNSQIFGHARAGIRGFKRPLRRMRLCVRVQTSPSGSKTEGTRMSTTVQCFKYLLNMKILLPTKEQIANYSYCESTSSNRRHFQMLSRDIPMMNSDNLLGRFYRFGRGDWLGHG